MSLIIFGWVLSDWQLRESLLQYQMFALHVMLTYVILLSQQINRFNKAEDRALLITDRHLYKMDPVKQYKPMKSIPLYNVNIYFFDIISCIHTAAEYNCQSYLECKCSLVFKESDNHILQFQKSQLNFKNSCNQEFIWWLFRSSRTSSLFIHGHFTQHNFTLIFFHFACNCCFFNFLLMYY